MKTGKYLRILLQFWKASLIQAMEYRASFFLGILANCLDFSFGLIQYALFFTVAENVAGWEMHQMLAFYGIFMTAFSLHFIFLYPNLEEINTLVNSGRLDLVLTKPVSAQIILSFRRLSLDELGSFLAAQTLIWGLFLSGKVAFSFMRFLAFLVAMFCSFSFIYAVFLLFLALAVWFEKLENMADLLWSLFGLCRYPADIYPPWLKRLFWNIIPIAFVTTVPARALLIGERPEILIQGLVTAAGFLLLSGLAWRWAMAGYTSSGG